MTPPAPLGSGGEVVPEVGRIAVLRANALGDLIVALPALEALRAAYPRSEITLLAGDWHAEFLAGRPGPVDHCVPVPASQGVRVDRPPEPAAVVESFLERMRARRFDLAVQLHGGGRHSNGFVRGLGARLAIGSRTPDAPPLDRWVPYIEHQVEVLRYLEVVGLAGAAPVALEPRLAVTAADRAEAARVLREAGPGGSGPLVVLHPGATDPRRRWPAAKLAAVGAELAGEGARLAVIGAGHERDLAGQVLAALGGRAADLCGRLSLGGLAGLLERCALLIGNDSGPAHLAGAVGTATVAVYWCVNLVNVGPLCRARHRAPTSWRLQCPVCGADCLRGSCPHDASLVAGIGVDEVLLQARDLLRSL